MKITFTESKGYHFRICNHLGLYIKPKYQRTTCSRFPPFCSMQQPKLLITRKYFLLSGGCFPCSNRARINLVDVVLKKNPEKEIILKGLIL